MSKHYVVNRIFEELDPKPPYYDLDGPVDDWESFILPEGYEKPTKEAFDAKFAEIYALQPMRRLRLARNYKIADTDWVFSPDLPSMTTEKLEEWKTYRQALRDITLTANPVLADDGVELMNVTWPEPPTN